MKTKKYKLVPIDYYIYGNGAENKRKLVSGYAINFDLDAYICVRQIHHEGLRFWIFDEYLTGRSISQADDGFPLPTLDLALEAVRARVESRIKTGEYAALLKKYLDILGKEKGGNP